MSCQNNNSCSINTPPHSCCRRDLLHKIMSLNFAINDLALYLDTHPNDSSAIRLHSEYSQKQITLTEEYQRLYGPLTINFTSNTWDWIDEPWPWERSDY